VEVDVEEETEPNEENKADGEDGAAEGDEKPADKPAEGTDEGKEGAAVDEGAVEGLGLAVVKVAQKKVVTVNRVQTLNKCVLFMSLDKMSAEMHERTTVFFIRSLDGPVPSIASSPDPGAMMGHLEFSVMSGEILQGIANVMHHVYLPVVQKGKVTEDDVQTEQAEVAENLRHELNLNINRFEQQVCYIYGF
jgi:hypothetical protein